MHNLASRMLQRLGKMRTLADFISRRFTVIDYRLAQTMWGMDFQNPIGLAAGMDKTGMAQDGWGCFGFGFLGVGGFTKDPQEGNQKPRLFRLPEDGALINRMGFNNPGAAQALVILSGLERSSGPLVVNLGKSKETLLVNAPLDYAYSFGRLYHLGDVFVINVSSPNTPGLRNLQDGPALDEIVCAVQEVRIRCAKPNVRPKPILVKVSPDLTMPQLDAILTVIEKRKIDGITATNTTTSRDNLKSPHSGEQGGLSGAPLFRMSHAMIKYIRESAPALPIIGVGGIGSADDALKMLEAGANLLELYTALVFQGPSLVRDINRGLVARLTEMNATVLSFSPRVNRF